MRGQPQAYCFCVAGHRRGPWRPTQEDAKEDAVDAGFGERDEFSEIIYLTVPAEIWVTFDLVEVDARLPRPKATLKGGYPSRIERIIARRQGQQAA